MCRPPTIKFQPSLYSPLSTFKTENLIIFSRKDLKLQNHEIVNLRKTQVSGNDTKLSRSIHLLEAGRFCRGMWKGWIDDQGPRPMV